MTNHFVVTLTTTAPIRLSSVVTGVGATDLIKFISFQAVASNAGVIYIGGSNRTLTSSDYGWRIEIPVSSIPYAPTVIELTPPAVCLADFYILGTINDKLAIFVVK